MPSRTWHGGQSTFDSNVWRKTDRGSQLNTEIHHGANGPTRRHLLVGAAVGVLVAGSIGSEAQAATAVTHAAASGGLKILNSAPVSILNKGFGSITTIEVPGLVAASWPASWGRTIRLSFACDARAFALGRRTTLVRDSTTFDSVALTSLTNGNVTVATCVVKLPERARPINLEVALPYFALAAYPNEDVGPVSPVSVTLTDVATPVNSVSATSVVLASSQTKAWALELYGIWDHLDVQRRGSKTTFTYRHPRSVEVVSVGPAPSPDDATVVLSVDARLIRGSAVKQRQLNGAQLRNPPTSASTSGQARTLVVPIGRALAAGERLRIDFDYALIPSRPRMTSVRHAVVSISSAASPGAWRRAARADTLVDLTGSGRAGVVHEFLGTV